MSDLPKFDKYKPKSNIRNGPSEEDLLRDRVRHTWPAVALSILGAFLTGCIAFIAWLDIIPWGVMAAWLVGYVWAMYKRWLRSRIFGDEEEGE